MEIALVVLGVGFVILALVYRGTVQGFLQFLEGERLRNANERQLLLDRIQRPETVMPASAPDGPPERTSLYYGDDEDLKAELRRLEGIDGDGR